MILKRKLISCIFRGYLICIQAVIFDETWNSFARENVTISPGWERMWCGDCCVQTGDISRFLGSDI